MITKKSDCSQITKGQQNGVLQAIYECGTKHLRLIDYMNSTLVSWDWREALFSVSRISRLQDIYRISTPLFNRFINEAGRIDQSDSPKSHEIQERGANDFNPMLIAYQMPLSQKDYEVRELNRARELAMGSAYSREEYNQLVHFDEMDDEERNNLLTSIKSINKDELTTNFHINTHEIDSLPDKTSNKSNVIEKMLNQSILPMVIKKEASTTIDFFSLMIISGIFLIIIILCGGIILFY